jgi:hypothetical protein
MAVFPNQRRVNDGRAKAGAMSHGIDDRVLVEYTANKRPAERQD